MALQDSIRKTGLTNKEFAKSINLPKTRLDAILSGDLSKRADVAKVEKALGIHLTKQEKPILKPLQGVNPSKPNKPHSAKDQSCVRCGSDDGTIQTAHYTGTRQHQLGKGTGQKCDHLATADLCHKCHTSFDQPEQRKSISASLDFLICIFKTLERNLGVEFIIQNLPDVELEQHLFSVLLMMVKIKEKSY